jgi:NADH:ubiquinone oxidoreductase subunit 5 (subunit L)/multisubunit Na+/H+ antiporter MnhA subunit
MNGPGLLPYLVAGALLLGIGVVGVLSKRSALMVLMSIEILLNASILTLVAFWRFVKPDNFDAAAQGRHALVSLPWLTVGGRQLLLGLELNALVATLVSIVGLIVFFYAVGYMAKDAYKGRFFAQLSLFTGSMLALVFAADLITLFMACELVGLCSYLLIGFWFERLGVPAAASKAFFLTRLADLALLAGILLIGVNGSGRIDVVLAVSTQRKSARAFGLVFLGTPSEPAQEAHQAQLGLLVPQLAMAALIPLGLLVDAARLGSPLSRLLGARIPDVPLVTALALALAVAGVTAGVWARQVWPQFVVWSALEPVAKLFTGELGFKTLYRATGGRPAILRGRARSNAACTHCRSRTDQVSRDLLVGHRWTPFTQRGVAHV